MVTSICFQLIAAAFLAPASTEAIPADPVNLLAPDAAWPCWQGPLGSNAAMSRGPALVSDCADARRVWESGDTLGTGKTCGSGAWGCPDLQIGYGSPVVADGRVYCYYFQPTGTVYFKNGRNRAKDLIDANDVIHCWDAQTGKTLWKRVYKSAGLNWGAPGKTGPFLTACVRDGRVYAMGSMGKVYCVNAETGAALWDADIGKRYDMMVRKKALALSTGEFEAFNRDFLSAPMVIGPAVIVNTHKRVSVRIVRKSKHDKLYFRG